MPDMELPGEAPMAVASIAGSAATGLVNRSQDPWYRKTMEAICGALVGVVCGPGIADVIGANDSHARTGIAFAVGACGVLLLTLYLDLMKSGSIREWLARFVKPPGTP